MQVRFGGLEIGLGVLEIVGRDDLLVEERLVTLVIGLRLRQCRLRAAHGILRLLDPVPEVPVVQRHKGFSVRYPLPG